MGKYYIKETVCMSDVETFERVVWGSRPDRKETVSGSGSTMGNTVNIRRELPELFKKYSVQSIFDAPCGDGNWISQTRLGVLYSGGDLVPAYVSSAVSKGLPATQFDIRSTPFPEVDLWLCRACLYHLPILDIQLSIDNWVNSSIKYLLVTSHVESCGVKDIKLGGFRPLNLADYDYFGLNPPIDSVPDVTYGGYTEEMLLFENPSL